MLRIRLKRMGCRHNPSYRIVLMEARSKRDGRAIDELGHYHPKTKQPLFINVSKIEEWVKKGAQLTIPVKRLVESYKKEEMKNEGAK